MRNLAPRPAERNGGAFSHEDHLPHIILFPAVCYSCFSAIANGVRKWRSFRRRRKRRSSSQRREWQDSSSRRYRQDSGRRHRSKTPVAAAGVKTIELGLGYSYVSHAENQSKRVGLQGADASFTICFSRLDIKADVGYARASNVMGTGRRSDVLSYLVGPVFHPTTRRNFNTYVHALVGGARVSGPILTNDGPSCSGDGRRATAGWLAAELSTG
jgi:hypothetical protein